MAAPPSSSTSRRGSFTKCHIDGCLVDTHDEGVHQLPPYPSDLPLSVSLYISYDKDIGVFALRLRVSVALQNNTETTVIFLDIPTDQIASLSLDQRPQLSERLRARIGPSQPCLRLSLLDSAGVLIAPSATKVLDPETPSDAQVLVTLRMLSRSHAVAIYLPPDHDLCNDLFTAQVTALPDIPTPQGRRLPVDSSPARLDLKTLYRGKGGRIVPPNEAFGHPIGRDILGGNGADDGTNPLSAVELPPSYNETVPPSPPDALFSPRKRVRAGFGDDALQTQRGEGSDDKHEVCGQAHAILDELQASIAAAAAINAQLRATMQEAERAQRQGTEAQPSKSRAPRSPAASTTVTGSGTSSVSEALSEKLKAYLDERLLQFEQDMRAQHESRLEESLADYTTVENMEHYVGAELAETTVDFVDESRLWEAIQEGVDGVEDEMRTRMMNAWSS